MKSYFLYMNLILLPNVAFNQDFHLKGTFTEIPFPGEALNDTNSVHIESAFITVDVSYRIDSLHLKLKLYKIDVGCQSPLQIR